MPDARPVSRDFSGKEIETQSFPKAARLLRSGDYSRVFASPMRSRDEMFTVLARRRENGGARLGMAVSKKVARRAVDRNRIKRQIRERFRLCWAALSGLDVVVVARPGVVNCSNDELRQSLNGHGRRLTRMQKGKGAGPAARRALGSAV